MRLQFSTQMDDFGRMEARVLETIERLQVRIVQQSSRRANRCVHMSGVLETEHVSAHRIASLLLKLHGMLTAEVVTCDDACDPVCLCSLGK